jgi:hypothetical protein
MVALPVWAIGVGLVLAGREGVGFWLVAIGGATMLALLLSRAGDVGELHWPPS